MNIFINAVNTILVLKDLPSEKWKAPDGRMSISRKPLGACESAWIVIYYLEREVIHICAYVYR